MLARAVPIVLLCLLACKGKEKEKTPDPKSKVAAKAIDAAPVTPETKSHSGGMERFKDPTLYLDGEPVSVLRFGELPITLKPTWIEQKASVPFKRGDKGPRFRIVKERRYQFKDYFRELGIDLEKIKELHIYGGNQKAAAVIIPGENLRTVEGFHFRFGGAIWGKPLPSCPTAVGDGKCPDQIATMALYVDKVPPERVGGHFYFDGKKIEGIPYHGEPSRGGIRVYLEGVLSATIKRNKLVASEIEARGPEGSESYNLFEFIASQGVDTSTIQEAWLIEYDRRTKKYSREELLTLRFKAGEGGSGEVLVGPEETKAQVISLHTKALSPEDLPQLLPEEIEKADG